VQTDVADQESVTRLAKVTREVYPAIDVFVNNAAHIRQAAVAEMPVGQWDRTIAVNLRGTFLTCRAYLPEMLARRRGTIQNLISTDAMSVLAAYIPPKQGITGFNQPLAQEGDATGVRVIPFGPVDVVYWHYLSKNMYRFGGPAYSGFAIDSSPERKMIFLNPAGDNDGQGPNPFSREQIIHNPTVFWAKP
jgi:NAD(P)-dependent dehydrogenase (short-subunit alcohol dehydrogenase family)